eukprot:5128491-Prymnesium_polylepis.1
MQAPYDQATALRASWRVAVAPGLSAKRARRRLPDGATCCGEGTDPNRQASAPSPRGLHPAHGVCTQPTARRSRRRAALKRHEQRVRARRVA